MDIEFSYEFNKSSLKNINKNKINKLMLSFDITDKNIILYLAKFYENKKTNSILIKKLNKLNKFII